MSLVLVLVTLVVFGLLVPILGQFGSTNGVSGYLLKGQRYDRYAAESGVQEAIAWAQTNRAIGRHGVPCAGIQTGTLGTGNAARSATVKCIGTVDKGIPQATGSSPTYAVQAVGTGAKAIDLPGGSYRTSGAWWSNGGINAPGVDATSDYVGASGSCGSIQAAPAECNQNHTVDPPKWKTNPGGTPDVDPVRTVGCSGGNHVIPIEPGFHWQRRFFDAVVDADPEKGCGGGYVLWLKPGLHVFDFDFYGLDGNSPSLRAAGPVVVVGGTPSGWSGTAGGNQFAAARAAVRARNACVNDGQGATVVVAHDSYFEMNPSDGSSADLQICGAPVGGTPPISFAQMTDASDVDPPTETVSAAPTSFTADGHGAAFDWQPQTLTNQNLLLNRECNSGSNVPPCTAAQAMIGRLTGDGARGTVTMTMADPIPEGTRLTKLTLTLNHREQDRNGGIRDLQLAVTGLGDLGRADCAFDQIDQRTDWPRVNEAADVYTCDLSQDRLAYFHSKQPIRITYDVRLDNGGEGEAPASADLALDQVRLDASFQRPIYRNATSPLGTPYVLRVDHGARATFDGTVSTPSGNVLFDWADATESGFRNGAIVGSIIGKNLPDAPDFAPFELPKGGSYTDRVVTFTATVSGTDATGTLLTARVLFCDPNPVPEKQDPRCAGQGQQPIVLAWDARR